MSKPTPRLKVRDHFAMAALPAVLASPGIANCDDAAEHAYMIADSMLRERSGEAKKKRDEQQRADEQRYGEQQQLERAGWKFSYDYDNDNNIKIWFPPDGGPGVDHKTAIRQLNAADGSKLSPETVADLAAKEG